MLYMDKKLILLPITCMQNILQLLETRGTKYRNINIVVNTKG